MFNFSTLKSLTGNFAVLFIEDDEDLRNATLPIFERFFKRVDTASNGIEGLERYQSFKDETNVYYDIVISDIQMPQMNGIELSKALLKINPSQKIMITSAYNDKEYLIDLINVGVSGFFEKPINYENMIKVLYDVSTSILGNTRVRLHADYSFDMIDKILYKKEEIVELSVHEQKLMVMLCEHPNHYFSAVDIFNHIYYDQVEKEFSYDSVKSLIKRLRKKLPEESILNAQSCGYCIKILS